MLRLKLQHLIDRKEGLMFHGHRWIRPTRKVILVRTKGVKTALGSLAVDLQFIVSRLRQGCVKEIVEKRRVG